MSDKEKTLSIIKPDAVERNLAEKIKEIFVKNELIIKDSKKIQTKIYSRLSDFDWCHNSFFGFRICRTFFK